MGGGGGGEGRGTREEERNQHGSMLYFSYELTPKGRDELWTPL